MANSTQPRMAWMSHQIGVEVNNTRMMKGNRECKAKGLVLSSWNEGFGKRGCSDVGNFNVTVEKFNIRLSH